MTEDSTRTLQNAVVQNADGVVVRVHVQPKARREQIIGLHADRIKLAVTEPPDKGKANEAVIRLLATTLNLAASKVELLRGQTSRQKDLLVRDCAISDVRASLLAVFTE